MGLNLHIQRLDGTEHPAWDWLRMHGDREVMGIIDANGGSHTQPDFDPYATDPLFRPNDVAALRSAKWPEYNAERWRQLIDILEDKQWWIFLSV